jgi:hypothetical protein
MKSDVLWLGDNDAYKFYTLVKVFKNKRYDLASSIKYS